MTNFGIGTLENLRLLVSCTIPKFDPGLAETSGGVRTQDSGRG
jgi:hypothetical protein